jgi:hypothetical protein
MDIDIDFPDRDRALSLLQHIKASRLDKDKLVPHNTGVYLQSIPHDPITNLSNIDYKSAEERGYFKIDFLNVNVYKGVKDEEHLIQLMEQEPLWDLLLDESFVSLLFHLNGHIDILKQNPPTSVEKLAAILAIIRPAKRHLVGKSWDEIFEEVWKRPENGEYFFKKSHAHSYAMAIVVQMNLICEKISYGYN